MRWCIRSDVTDRQFDMSFRGRTAHRLDVCGRRVACNSSPVDGLTYLIPSDVPAKVAQASQRREAELRLIEI